MHYDEVRESDALAYTILVIEAKHLSDPKS